METEVCVGQVWHDLDSRERKLGRTVYVYGLSDQFAFVKSNKGRTSRIHKSRLVRFFALECDSRPEGTDE